MASKLGTVKASGARRITAAEMKYMRRTAGYTWTDCKTNAQIAKELKITQILNKLLEYRRSWIQHVNRMPRNRLPRVMKHYCPNGRRNHGRPLKRLLDTWDRNRSTSGPTAWQIYDDDDDDDYIAVGFAKKITTLWDGLSTIKDAATNFLKNSEYFCETTRRHMAWGCNLRSHEGFRCHNVPPNYKSGK